MVPIFETQIITYFKYLFWKKNYMDLDLYVVSQMECLPDILNSYFHHSLQLQEYPYFHGCHGTKAIQKVNYDS